MRTIDKPEFVRILMGLSSIKPGKPMTPEGLDMYWAAMRQEWGIGEFREAAGHLAGTCEFMPNPYHFEQLRKAARPTAGEAWSTVLGWAASGSYRDCDSCGDPIIDRAVKAMGGYRAIAMHDEDKQHFAERRFADHYESMQDADTVRNALPFITRPALNGPQPVAGLLQPHRGTP